MRSPASSRRSRTLARIKAELVKEEHLSPQLAELYKLLGNTTRLKILLALAQVSPLRQSMSDNERDSFQQDREGENQMKRRKFVTCITAAGILIPQLGVTGELRGAEIRKDRAGDNEALLEFDNTWAKAEKEGDLSSLDRILDKDFALVDFDGAMYTKSGYLDSLSKTKFVSYSITDQVVRSWGETGIVTGKWHARWLFDGKEEQGTLRFTAVFSRRGDTWYAVAEAVVKLIG